MPGITVRLRRPDAGAHTSPASRAADVLRESEQRLRAILDTAVDAIITSDERGIIDSANTSTERLFGYAPRELIGQNVSILMPSPYREEHDGYLRRYLGTGEGRIIGFGREVIGMRKDGRHIPIHLSISEVPLERGRLFTAIIHDISQRRRLERQVLEASADEQRRIGRDLHDGICQNLVGAALGMSALANRLAAVSPVAAAQAREIATLVRATATQARNLARGLAPLDVATDGLAAALEKLARETTELAGVRCDARCDPSAVPADPAAATHLYRIAQEAVSNALKHADATCVEIRLVRVTRGCALVVFDDGRGFAKVTGGGLGLQTMGYRAHMIGGALTVESVPGGGTTVRCAYPISGVPLGSGNGHTGSQPANIRPRCVQRPSRPRTVNAKAVRPRRASGRS